MTRLLYLFATTLLLCFSCSPDSFRCAIPKPDRVKKYSVNHTKVYQMQRQEYLMARAQDQAYDELIRSQQQRQVKTFDPEEWDCPRPGSAHARMIQKHRKRLEAQNVRNLKKKELLSGRDRTDPFK